MRNGHSWDGCDQLKHLYSYEMDIGKKPNQSFVNCHKEGAVQVAMDDGIFTAACMHNITYG